MPTKLGWECDEKGKCPDGRPSGEMLAPSLSAEGPTPSPESTIGAALAGLWLEPVADTDHEPPSPGARGSRAISGTSAGCSAGSHLNLGR